MLGTREAIRLLLLADATVLGLVSTRIYSTTAEQSALLPVVVYRRIDESEEEILASPGTAGLKTERYRFTIAASGVQALAEAVAIDEAIYTVLEGFMGTVTDAGSPPESLFINSIFKKSSFDFRDDITKAEQVISEYEIASEYIQSS